MSSPLNELAAEVLQVDLRERTIETSRRLRIRRGLIGVGIFATVAALAAALIAIAVVVVTG